MLPSESPDPPVEDVRTHEIGSQTYVVADVKPLDVDGTRTTAVGAALFLLAFLALLPFHHQLADAGRTWWLGTCLAGSALGVFGWGYCRHRRTRRARAQGDDQG